MSQTATPNINSESHEDLAKTDLTLYGSPIQIRPNRIMRKSGPFGKMLSEDQHTDNQHPAGKLIRMNARRGSSFVRATSEDQEDNKGLSPREDIRRGSTFIKTSDDANEDILEKTSTDILGGYIFKFVDDVSDDTSYPSGSFSKDIVRASSFMKTDSDTNDELFSTGRTPKDIRRSSSLLKTHDTNEETSAASDKFPKDVRRGSSFIRTIDDSLEDNMQRRSDIRRGSSIIRMISEEFRNEELYSSGQLSTNKSEVIRRSSAPTKLSSDSDDSPSRKSSRADMRRGSSFVKMVSEEEIEENATDRSDLSEKLRKCLDNSYRHSLESISEYKANTFSSASLYPSINYNSISLESPTSDISTDFAMRSENESNTDTDRTNVNSSLSYLSRIKSENGDNFPSTNAATHGSEYGTYPDEWNNFWTNYTSRRNFLASPCPSNSGEDVSLGSNTSTPKGYTDKSNIVLTLDEVNEALECTQRVMDILRGAMKRSGDVTSFKHDSSRGNNTDDKKNKDSKNNPKDKNASKSTNSSCIDLILSHTGVADILKKVINKRKEVIMPGGKLRSRSSSECSKK